MELSGLALILAAGLGAALLLSFVPADRLMLSAPALLQTCLARSALVADIMVQTIGLVSAVPVLLFAVGVAIDDPPPTGTCGSPYRTATCGADRRLPRLLCCRSRKASRFEPVLVV